VRVREWRCIPCRDRSRLRQLERTEDAMAKKIKAVGEMREELGVAPTPTARYRLLAGRHARFRGGEYESFVAGDVVELTASEVLRMASRIKEVAEDAVQRGTGDFGSGMPVSLHGTEQVITQEVAVAAEPPLLPGESKKARRRREKRRVAALVAEEVSGGEADPEMCACGHARDAHRGATDGPFVGGGPHRTGCWLCPCAGYQPPPATEEAGR
jgi:hypothetical protein